MPLGANGAPCGSEMSSASCSLPLSVDLSLLGCVLQAVTPHRVVSWPQEGLLSLSYDPRLTWRKKPSSSSAPPAKLGKTLTGSLHVESQAQPPANLWSRRVEEDSDWLDLGPKTTLKRGGSAWTGQSDRFLPRKRGLCHNKRDRGAAGRVGPHF